MRKLFGIAVFVWGACFSIVAHGMDSVPQAEYRARRVALAEKLKGGAAVLFAAKEPGDELTLYRQDSDFFYLTGWTEPGAALVVIGAGPETVVPRSGETVPAHGFREILFLPLRNLVLEKYTGEKVDAATAGASTKAGVDAVLPLTSLPEVLGSFVAQDRRRARSLWTQADTAAAAATMSFLGTSLGLDTTTVVAGDVRLLTTALRTVKSPAEIALLRKASEASIEGQLAGMRSIRPGVQEQAVAGAELGRFMAEGCERWSYPPIVGSGMNSTVLHYSTNEHAMEKGGVVVIDAACERSMYASDITRTMPVSGRFTARQKEIYDVVLGAQRAAAAAFVAGRFRLGTVNERGPNVTDTLDKIAYDYINTHGKDLHGEPLGKYFLHGLGHSVGIDVHDPMDYTHTKLDKGMVFTIEPGVYLPEEKIGVRVEDVFYVNENGRLVDLIERLAHDAGAVEAAMHP